MWSHLTSTSKFQQLGLKAYQKHTCYFVPITIVVCGIHESSLWALQAHHLSFYHNKYPHIHNKITARIHNQTHHIRLAWTTNKHHQFITPQFYKRDGVMVSVRATESILYCFNCYQLVFVYIRLFRITHQSLLIIKLFTRSLTPVDYEFYLGLYIIGRLTMFTNVTLKRILTTQPLIGDYYL